MKAQRIECDVLVVGDGAAGIAAARAAAEAGARVAIVSDGPGATAMGTGAVWGAAAEPFSRWADAGRFQRGGRYVTVGGWVVAEVVGALQSALDLSRVPANAALGVVDLPTHPCWNARMLASALGASVVALDAVADEDGFHATARRFDTDGVVDAVGEALRSSLRGKGIGALLFPPVLGLRRDDVAQRLSALVGTPVGEALGEPGDPLSMRFQRSLRAWIPPEVVVTRGHAVARIGRAPEVRVNDAPARARAVVLATGGVTGGGVRFDASVHEATAGAPLWLRSSLVLARPGAARGEDPLTWFASGAPPVFEVGLRCNERGQVLGADGADVPAPWLFAAGELLRSRAGGGIAGALATGALAGAEAARHARS